MIAQIRAELLKIRTTRTTIGLILAMIAPILLFTLLTGLLTHPSGLASREDQRQLLSLGSLADVFSALAGVLLVTSEYRYGTIRPTGVASPSYSAAATFCCSRSAGSPARPCGARSAPASERSSTTKSAQSSPCSPGTSSSTPFCSASPHRSGGSRQPVLRTHSWASESSTWSRRAPARSR
jgi:hypothetical protein